MSLPCHNKIVYLDNKLVTATMHGCNYNVKMKISIEMLILTLQYCEAHLLIFKFRQVAIILCSLLCIHIILYHHITIFKLMILYYSCMRIQQQYSGKFGGESSTVILIQLYYYTTTYNLIWAYYMHVYVHVLNHIMVLVQLLSMTNSCELLR